MSKLNITDDESKTIAVDVLEHCYGPYGFNQDMVERVADVIIKSYKTIINKSNTSEVNGVNDNKELRTPEDDEIIDIKGLRTLFEEQHRNRDLTKHSMRKTYVKPQIAALWNQHIKTARAIVSIVVEKIKRKNQ